MIVLLLNTCFNINTEQCILAQSNDNKMATISTPRIEQDMQAIHNYTVTT